MILSTDTLTTVEAIGGVIGNFGFSVFVAVWLLWKSHKDTEIMKDSIDKLENAILELNTYIHTLNDTTRKISK